MTAILIFFDERIWIVLMFSLRKQSYLVFYIFSDRSLRPLFPKSFSADTQVDFKILIHN